jgi:hypothetical protein
MTSIPALRATFLARPVMSGSPLALALFGLVGFAELVAAQSLSLSLTGWLVWLPAFAAGAAGAAELIRRGRVETALLAALAMGVSTVAACYFSSPVLAILAALAMGAVFPSSSQGLVATLGGALAGSLVSPFLIPVLGLHGISWICLGLSVAVCVLAARLGGVTMVGGARPPLTASFGAGAFLFALLVIWKHLLSLMPDSSGDVVLWMWAAVLLGLFLGAMAKPIRWGLLFQCGALLLTAQVVIWDRVPGWFNLGAMFLLLTPPSAVAGAIYRRLATAPAAIALGGLTGATLAMFVLAPGFGSEASLKGLVLVLCVLWAVFLLREPLTRARLASAAAIAILMLVVLLGRWWNWGLLTAGNGHSFGKIAAPVAGVRYLPASLIFKHEDVWGGFTTVVEQTSVTGEVAHTVRTLFRNGRFQGDDSQESRFVPGQGSALLIGLGTGRGAAELKHLGYGEIVVAETSEGVVKAAGEVFGAANEGILADFRVKLERKDGRSVLLASSRQFGLIAIDMNDAALDGREFYRLAHRRLRLGGVLQRWVTLDNAGRHEIDSQATAARSVFSNVTLRQDGAQVLLVAADGPVGAHNLDVLRQYR